MSKALVLGGGGPVGIGWEFGLVAGLAELGVDLGSADLIVGTSAGSVVGAALTVGVDADVVLRLASQPLPMPTTGETASIAALLDTFLEGLRTGEWDRTRAELGRIALDAPTAAEAQFVSAFDVIGGVDWPARFACTAVNTTTGKFQVWDGQTGADLQHAVASSCAVPGVFPPVTIGDSRYMDGGARSALNADLAAGHDAVVAISCFVPALPEGFDYPAFDAMAAQDAGQLDQLRAKGARVTVIIPGSEFLDISGWGLNLLDPTRAAAAFDAGRRQAEVELQPVGAVWG